MKKKMIAAAALGAALTLGMSVNVLATSTFVGSKTQQSVGAESAEITTESGETVETVVGTTTDLETLLEESGLKIGETTESGETVSIETFETPVIKITPVQETQAASASHDESNAGKSFWEKATDYTSSGLTYSANEQTNLVYEAASKSENTESFLGKFDGLVEQVTETIRELIAATTEEYQDASDVPDEEVSVSDYSPLALFDVSANQAAKDAIGENGTVTLTVALDGAHEDSRMFGLHFKGEEDTEAAREALENDFDNAILNYDVEIFAVTPGEGTATFTMSNSFSPVMIMIQETAVATEESAEEEAAAEETEETAEEATAETAEVAETSEESSSQGNLVLWIVIIIIILAVIIYLIMKNRKKDNTQESADKK
ncbi:MAG: hypothetical protein LUE16_07150 [Lachnospiraceae bacterium]|nr:hypothetical protein [Lachnospiraceae bacterium]